MATAEIFLEGLYGPECPRSRGDRLWFTDLFGGKVMSVGFDGSGLRTELEVDDRPQTICWAPNGDLMVLAMDRRQVLRRSFDGHLAVHADLNGFAGGPCSGMFVDDAGRAYVGNFGFDLEGAILKHGRSGVGEDVRVRARLALVSFDGWVREAAGDFDVLTNAPVVSEDGKTLIVGEMFGRRLVAFDRDGEGRLSRRRVWAELGERRPDALALDVEGAIWFTHPAGAECVRVAEGGKVLDVVATGDGAYGCGLGGPDGRSLFITTMPSASPGVADAAPNGRILVARVDAPLAEGPGRAQTLRSASASN